MSNETVNPQITDAVAPIGADQRGSRRVIVGTVTSSNMDKTATVTVIRRVRDRRFHKFLTRRVKYHVEGRRRGRDRRVSPDVEDQALAAAQHADARGRDGRRGRAARHRNPARREVRPKP
jgi:hypothetical protein